MCIRDRYYRDVRINAIYEGTTTIQGMDILGRKVRMQNGQALNLFVEEVKSTIDTASQNEVLKKYAKQLTVATQSLQKTTAHLVKLSIENKPEVFLSDATLYLEFFGIFTVSWLWLKQAIIAQNAIDNKAGNDEYLFYQGKVHTMKYYFEYELPKIQALRDRLMSEDRITLDMNGAFIN